MKEKSLGNVCKEKIYTGVFNKYAADMNSYLYYKFGNLALAEDAVQEAFVKLWQNCKKVALQNAKSYLFTVANNFSLNKVKRQKFILNYVKQHHNPKIDHQDPSYKMEEEEFKIKLNTAIGQLKPKLRTTFLLHRIDKKTYNEIAEIEGVTVKAIEKRMSQALVFLRNHIDNI